MTQEQLHLTFSHLHFLLLLLLLLILKSNFFFVKQSYDSESFESDGQGALGGDEGSSKEEDDEVSFWSAPPDKRRRVDPVQPQDDLYIVSNIPSFVNYGGQIETI